MTIHDRARRMAEEEFPDDLFEGTPNSCSSIGWKLQRLAYANAMEKVLGTLDKCRAYMDHDTECRDLVGVKGPDDPAFIEWKHLEANGGACNCGFRALLTELTNLLDDGQQPIRGSRTGRSE